MNCKASLLEVLERKACVLGDLGQLKDALGLLGQAVALAGSSLRTAEDGKKPREYLSEALWNFARLLRESGQEKDASRLDAERIALWKKRPVTELVDLASSQATRADLIGYGATPVLPAGQKVRELDRGQAAANLCLALSGGFKEFDKLRANLDLVPLLDRADVKPLLAGQPSLERSWEK